MTFLQYRQGCKSELKFSSGSEQIILLSGSGPEIGPAVQNPKSEIYKEYRSKTIPTGKNQNLARFAALNKGRTTFMKFYSACYVFRQIERADGTLRNISIFDNDEISELVSIRSKVSWNYFDLVILIS